MALLKKPTSAKIHTLVTRLLLLLLFISANQLSAQQNSLPSGSKSLSPDVPKTYIRNIIVQGNKKTKPFVIIREMGFGEGDPIPTLNIMDALEKARINIFNLKIFNYVGMNIRNWQDDSLDVEVTVVERWYIIPIPIFQLADRNVNEWWKDRGRDLNRIQYGLALNWENFRGRNESLKVSASLGFAQLLEFNYNMPGLSPGGRFGASVYFNLLRSKRLPYATQNDKLVFHYDDNFVKKSFELGPKFIFRRNIHQTHFVESRFGYRWVADTIQKLNENYFLDDDNKQTFINLSYAFEIDRRNIRAYPTGGYFIAGKFENFGLGLQPKVNLTRVSLQASKYFTLDKKSKHASGHMAKAQVSFPKEQPYNLQRGMGYFQDFVRGYEYFVIDGQNYALFKNEYRFKLLSFRMSDITKNKGPAMMNAIPFSIYLKGFFDAGYVHDRFWTDGNSLRNQWLYGWGAGIDIVTYNNRLLRLEYAFNRKLQKGLYLHVELPL
jgi:outer membrane protein assembly factor BamA